MLEWIYTGNMPAAWQLCDEAWPSGRPGKEAFLDDFKTQLRSSPFYDGLVELNTPRP